MAENQPIGGGSYLRDESGELIPLVEGQYQLDPVTREVKLPKPARQAAKPAPVPAPVEESPVAKKD